MVNETVLRGEAFKRLIGHDGFCLMKEASQSLAFLACVSYCVRTQQSGTILDRKTVPFTRYLTCHNFDLGLPKSSEL
jgi:hypothetical protein